MTSRCLRLNQVVTFVQAVVIDPAVVRQQAQQIRSQRQEAAKREQDRLDKLRRESERLEKNRKQKKREFVS